MGKPIVYVTLEVPRLKKRTRLMEEVSKIWLMSLKNAEIHIEATYCYRTGN